MPQQAKRDSKESSQAQTEARSTDLEKKMYKKKGGNDEHEATITHTHKIQAATEHTNKRYTVNITSPQGL